MVSDNFNIIIDIGISSVITISVATVSRIKSQIKLSFCGSNLYVMRKTEKLIPDLQNPHEFFFIVAIHLCEKLFSLWHLHVTYTETHPSFLHFLTNLCAIVGGICLIMLSIPNPYNRLH